MIGGILFPKRTPMSFKGEAQLIEDEAPENSEKSRKHINLGSIPRSSITTNTHRKGAAVQTQQAER